MKKLVFLLTVAIFVNVTPPTHIPEKGDKSAQALGTLCQTSIGVCVWPPRPLGSACSCGSAAGFIRR